MAFKQTGKGILWVSVLSGFLLLNGCSYLPWGKDEQTEEDLAFEQDFASEYDSEFEGGPLKEESSSKSKEEDFFADSEPAPKDAMDGAMEDSVMPADEGGFASIDQATDKNEIKADIETLQSQQEALITRVRELQEIVQSMEPRLTATQDRLETSLGETTGQSEELKPQIDALQAEIIRLNDEIARLQKAPKPEPVQRKSKPRTRRTSKTPKEYDNALTAYKAGKYDESILLFQELSLKNPPNSLKDNILFWIGSNYLKLEMYDDAISQFQAVLNQYPKGNKVHDSRYLLGVSYQKKGDTGRALDILEAALKANPPSEVRKKVQKQLMEIK